MRSFLRFNIVFVLVQIVLETLYAGSMVSVMVSVSMRPFHYLFVGISFILYKKACGVRSFALGIYSVLHILFGCVLIFALAFVLFTDGAAGLGVALVFSMVFVLFWGSISTIPMLFIARADMGHMLKVTFLFFAVLRLIVIVQSLPLEKAVELDSIMMYNGVETLSLLVILMMMQGEMKPSLES